MTQQQAFTLAKNAWNAYAWTPTATELWQRYCRRHPIQNQIGEQKYMFPYIAFLSVNIQRIMVALPIIYTPPLD